MSKIQRTTRILVKRGSSTLSIYCSCAIAREVRSLIYRLNQIYVPTKSGNDELYEQLRRLSHNRPEEFTNSSIAVLS